MSDETPRPRARRGFAAMSPEKQREIARKGGKSAHAKGVAHKWDSAEAQAAGRKAGANIVAKYGREHMAAIGRIGGLNHQAKRRRSTQVNPEAPTSADA